MTDETKGAGAMIRERFEAMIRKRFEAMAAPPGGDADLTGGRRVNVVRVADDHYRGEGRDDDHQPEGDWAAWVALAEDILGIQRFEVTMLLDRCEALRAEVLALRGLHRMGPRGES